MKKLLSSFVFFSVLLIVGCQENSITNPVQSSENSYKNSDIPLTGTIQLQGSLDNPYPVFNSYFIISGEVTYQLMINYLDPIPPNPQEILSLQLNANADLSSYCTVCGPLVNETPAGVIEDQTNDIMYITDDGSHTIVKTFPIQKRDDGMVLKCSFLVNTNGVTLDAMWLELNDGTLASGNGTD